MTISNSNNKINYVPDGIQLIFAYNFRVDNATDMLVYLDDVPVTTGWTISGLGEPTGGNVTFNVAPVGDTLTLIREVAYVQETDYQPYDPFPAETHERALDYLTMQTQQLAEVFGRTPVAPPSDDGTTDYTLPAYSGGDVIGWDENNKIMVNYNLIDRMGANANMISYDPSPAAGVIPRTIENRLRDSIDAGDFGIFPGGGDVSVAVQALLTYALGKMSFVFFPPGTYRLDSKITLNSTGGNSLTGFGIVGRGTISPRGGSVSVMNQSGVTFRASHTDRVFELIGVPNLVLRDFEVNSLSGSDRWNAMTGGDYSTSNDMEAIYVASHDANRLAGPRMRNVMVRHQPGDGIRVISTNNLHLEDVNVSWVNGGGIVHDDGSYNNTGTSGTINAYSALGVFNSCRVGDIKGPAVFLGTHLANTTEFGGTRFQFENLEILKCGLDYPEAVSGDNIQFVMSGVNTISFGSSAIAADVYSVLNGSGIGIYAQNSYNLTYNSSRLIELKTPIVANKLENFYVHDSAVVIDNGEWPVLVDLRSTLGPSRNFSVRRLVTGGHSLATATDVLQNYFGVNYADPNYFYGILELQPRYAAGSINGAGEFSTFLGNSNVPGAGVLEWRTGTGTPDEKRVKIFNDSGVPIFDSTGKINSRSVRLGFEGISDSGFIELGRNNNSDYWKMEAGIVGVSSGLHLYYQNVEKGIFSSATGEYIPTSSRASKKFIEPISYDAAALILDVEVVNFLYNDQDPGDTLNVGVIADDAMEAVPGLVGVNDNGEVRGFNYAGMGPYLLKVIQDQEERIKALEHRVNQLI